MENEWNVRLQIPGQKDNAGQVVTVLCAFRVNTENALYVCTITTTGMTFLAIVMVLVARSVRKH